MGRYIRIYHTDSTTTPWLSLTGLKVFSRGVDVAAGLTSKVGADGGIFEDTHHNPAALTDSKVGGPYDGLRAMGNLAWVLGISGRGYIQLDLGSVQRIDFVKLSGRGDAYSAESQQLSVYISTESLSSDNFNQGIADQGIANRTMAQLNVSYPLVDSTANFSDTLADMENLIGTVKPDTLTGDASANKLFGKAGDDRLVGSAGNDILDGGSGRDTAFYGHFGLGSTINADLAAGRVDKTIASTPGTTVNIGAIGRYIRIYHTDASTTPWLSLAELTVFSGGVNVAAGIAGEGGSDDGAFDTTHHNRAALTDGRLGGIYDGLRAIGNLAWVHSAWSKAYIELDLGTNLFIDQMVLSGRADQPFLAESWNLEIELRSGPSANPLKFNVPQVATAVLTTSADTLVDIEDVWGTEQGDTLRGNANPNQLTGGGGSDTYRFGRGCGPDVVYDNGGPGDVVRFEGTPATKTNPAVPVTSANLSFGQQGQDLKVGILGGNDSITIKDWYAGPANQIEEFRAEDMKLMNAKMDQLVSVMAGFGPPAAGQTSWSAAQQQTIAQYWAVAA